MHHKSKKYFRIGFMGSSSSGKTTTATLLSNKIGFRMQKEVESSLLERWIKDNRIRSKEDITPDLSLIFQHEALAERKKLNQDLTSAIVDRTEAELYAYHLIRSKNNSAYKTSISFKEECSKLMRNYTHLFLFPNGLLPLEDNGYRTISEKYREEVFTTIISVLEMFRLEYICLSDKRLTKQERLNEILEWIEI